MLLQLQLLDEHALDREGLNVLDGNTTYLIKVRDCKSFPFFRKRFIDLLKNVEWVLAVEVMQNKHCFYVETDDAENFEHFLNHMNEEFKKRNRGDIIHSRIQNVFLNKKKGIANG